MELNSVPNKYSFVASIHSTLNRRNIQLRRGLSCHGNLIPNLNTKSGNGLKENFRFRLLLSVQTPYILTQGNDVGCSGVSVMMSK